jgi:hypothetical protein
MAALLRCWSCDKDLPAPPFSNWQANRPPDSMQGVVRCAACGRRYRLSWTAKGWQITEALQPGRALRSPR